MHLIRSANRRITPHSKARGFTLVELMIAITLSLVVIAGLSSIFLSNLQASNEIKRTNQQNENGRYAIESLSADLELAGFLGEFDLTLAGTVTLPADKPNPCNTTLATLEPALPIHIQGYDNTSSVSCITDVRGSTDVLVIRRISTCDTTDCAGTVGAAYFQASLCQDADELGNANYQQWYRFNTYSATTSTNNTNFNRTLRNCADSAPIRRLKTHIYFVANNNNAGDGIPTLKRAELGNSADPDGFTVVPLAEGIENLQIEYGMDDDADGRPDNYTTNPDTYNGCSAAACRITNLMNVVSTRLHILSRSTDAMSSHTDTKTYNLGPLANGNPNVAGPFNDNFKRHVFTTLVQMYNPSGR